MDKLNTISLTLLIFITVSLLVSGIVGLAFLVEGNVWAGVTLLVIITFILSYMAARILKS